ncbi:MAG: TonB family protein [Paludibacteraceae bacterium]|nr:TonB family protein [Paludibacteraceae bacterium]
MAFKGKTTCRILKDIRRQIAEANDIDLVIKECTYQGDCAGTCPRCEAEVAHLERELARRKAMGKAACITGIATSALMGMPAAAQTHDTLSVQQTYQDSISEEFAGVILDDFSECMPEFPGGQKALFEFLTENVHYPEEAQKEGKEGRAICQFVVNQDSTLSNFEVVRSSGDERLDAEAIRVLKSMPNWKPGTQRGKPVNVKYTIPVNFRLTKDDTIHIKGQVLDETGLPLIGASVQVDGTELWTVTDVDGLFELDACQGDTLLFNYIVYKTIKRLSEPNMVVRFAEEDIVTEAEEVVLTGYGSPTSFKATGCRTPRKSRKNNKK